jgi:N-acetyl-anhydromuramoyl-L-alanine amidase
LANHLNSFGWLTGVSCKPSPNFNSRPAGTEISLLVIHNISLPPGIFGGSAIEDFFLNRLNEDGHPYFREIITLRVSAHFLIKRDGEVIQFVSTLDRAWHAGQSEWLGKPDCNNYSLGIELEGCDDRPFTEKQYQKLAGLTTDLMSAYPSLTLERVVGHSDVAPDRKTDPGPEFDWLYYRRLVEDLRLVP